MPDELKQRLQACLDTSVERWKAAEPYTDARTEHSLNAHLARLLIKDIEVIEAKVSQLETRLESPPL
jgi:hypothetical protein